MEVMRRSIEETPRPLVYCAFEIGVREMKVLIVEDIKPVRVAVRRILVRAGYRDDELYEAENGVEALALARTISPDLILSDWNMPEMSGLELLTALRAEASRVVFGFLTSEFADDMRDIARAAGADFFLAKPLTEEAIRVTLKPLAETLRRNDKPEEDDPE